MGTPAPRFAVEHPSFPLSAVPPVLLSNAWQDASWRNDAMPSFIHTATGIVVWVNYPQADMREEGAPAFIVERAEWDSAHGWQHDLAGEGGIFEADSVEALLGALPAAILAQVPTGDVASRHAPFPVILLHEADGEWHWSAEEAGQVYAYGTDFHPTRAEAWIAAETMLALLAA